MGTSLLPVEDNIPIQIRRLQRKVRLQCLFFSTTVVILTTIFALSMISSHRQLIHRMEDIEKYNQIFLNQLNITMKDLNSTVEKVQEDVEQTAQEVNDNISTQNSILVFQFAGIFSILGSLISLWHIASHLRNLHVPQVQRKIIAILWMVPIYTVSSWLSLVFVNASSYLGLFKDIYEAYCIYCFLSFLISILGRGDRDAVIDVLVHHADHLRAPLRLFPCCQSAPDYTNIRQKAEAVLNQCQFLCMQFVFLRPLTTVAMMVSDHLWHNVTENGGGGWDPMSPQFYINLVTNISIGLAFTGLLRFYHVIKDDLKWCHPFSKFLSVKAIVFMTFWQGIAIHFMAQALNLGSTDNHVNSNMDVLQWSQQAQSFLICLEMFVFAIIHCFVFPTDEWEPGYCEREKRRIKASFGDSLALKDFVDDVKIVMKSRSKRYKKVDAKLEKDEKELVMVDESGEEDGNQTFSLCTMDRDTRNCSEESNNDLNDLGDEDTDWVQGWSRIEEFIDEIELSKIEHESSSNNDNAMDEPSAAELV